MTSEYLVWIKEEHQAWAHCASFESEKEARAFIKQYVANVRLLEQELEAANPASMMFEIQCPDDHLIEVVV